MPEIASCLGIQLQLPLYLQGRLNLRKSQQIYAHLNRCKICRIAADDSTSYGAAEQKPVSRSVVLKTGAVATGAVVLFIFSGLFLPGPSLSSTPLPRSAPSPSPALSPSSAPSPHKPTSGFLAKAGAAYYLPLHVLKISTAEEAVTRLLLESPVLKSRGPYAGRFYLTVTPAQLIALMEKLNGVGDPGIVRVGHRRPWGDDPSEPNACSVSLDLLGSGY